MNNMEKWTFKKAIKAFSELPEYTNETVNKWFYNCDWCYQQGTLTYNELEMFLEIAKKFI